MKTKLLSLFLIAGFIGICLALHSCSSGASGTVTPSSVPVAVEFLDNATGIDPTSSFQQTFSAEVDPTTVNSSTFFIVAGSAANIAVTPAKAFSSVCEASSALPGTVADSGDHKKFTLTPAATLSYSTTYTVCLTGDITFATGTKFTALSVTFTTAAQGASGSLFLSSISPFGNDVNLNTNPFTAVFTNSLDEALFSNYLFLYSQRAGNIAIPGSWTLTDASKQTAQFTPTAEPICDKMTFQAIQGLPDNTDQMSLASTLTKTFTTRFYYDSDFTDSTLQSNFTTCWTEYNKTGLTTLNSFTTNGLTFTMDPPNHINEGGLNYIWYKTMDDTSFSVTMHVSSISLSPEVDAGTWGRIGLIFSDSLSPSTMIGVDRYIQNSGVANCTLLVDDANNITSGDTAGNPCDIRNDIYLKLTRSNQSFGAYYSTDGTNFTQLGTTQTMAGIGTGGADFIVGIISSYNAVTGTKSFTTTVRSVDFSF